MMLTCVHKQLNNFLIIITNIHEMELYIVICGIRCSSCIPETI
jgi:hypothetical protein